MPRLFWGENMGAKASALSSVGHVLSIPSTSLALSLMLKVGGVGAQKAAGWPDKEQRQSSQKLLIIQWWLHVLAGMTLSESLFLWGETEVSQPFPTTKPGHHHGPPSPWSQALSLPFHSPAWHQRLWVTFVFSWYSWVCLAQCEILLVMCKFFRCRQVYCHPDE